MSGLLARPARLAGFLTALVLLATVDERSFGLIPDGKQILSAAAALSRFGELGISRDFLKAPPRKNGDAVSGYGMLPSLVETVPMLLARALHRIAPGVPSTPLFVLVPILALALAAWALARAAELLGFSPFVAAAVGLALVFSTPLWVYAGSDYSEALQAAPVSLTVLGAVGITRAMRDAGAAGREDVFLRRWSLLCGASAGAAILTKTLLAAAVGPVLLAAFVALLVGPPSGASAVTKPGKRSGRGRTNDSRPSKQKYSLALVVPFFFLVLLWAWFDFLRFGRLFGGYANEHFDYPFFTGLLRLTIFPNKGLLFYAPLVLLAPLGFVVLRRREPRLAWALTASAAAILAASAAWWAWDGQAAWGPRLLVPALPPLVLLAGLGAFAGGPRVRAAGIVLGAAGVLVNALGAFVPFPGVYALADRVPPQPITEPRAAGTRYEIGPGPGGVLLASGPHHLSLTPGWSPIRVHVLFLAAKLRGDSSSELKGLEPPFRPELPKERAPALRLALSAPRPGWGRVFLEGEEGRESDPYRVALRDQAVRAIDQREYVRAAALAGDLLETGGAPPDPFDVALAAESARLGNGGDAAALSFLSKQISPYPPSSCHPWILFVRSMAAPPGDLSCMPQSLRVGFGRGLEIARRQGWPLTEWARAALRGR